jgi:hypothetical protein
MSAWLMPIAEREALLWIVAEQRSAFPAYRGKDAARLRRGDIVLLYTTRGCFHNPTRDRGRVAGCATVTGKVFTLPEPVRFGDRAFPLGISLKIELLAAPRTGVVLADLVNRLGASFPNRRGWAASLRRALVPLHDSDASVLIDLLGPLAYPYVEMRDHYAA